MRRALLVTLGLAVAAPGAAPAQAADRGMFSITPARRDVSGRPPVDLVPTVVGNSTSRTYRVEVFPVLLRQTLAGPFVFSEAPAPLRAARNVLSATPRSFVLRPHTTRTVRLRWNVMPEGRDAIEVGVVFQGTPSGQSGATVRTISRLLSLNFLRDPGARPARGRLVGLSARPDPTRARRLLLVARVRNRGGSVGRPCEARARVRDARGRVVRRVRWRGDVVAPGADREFPIPLPGTLRAGSYTAAVRLCFGKSRLLHRTTRFRLVADGVLPSPALTLRAFNAAGQPGEHAHARGTFVSTGTAAAASDVVLRLYRRRGADAAGAPLQTVRMHVGPLQPRAKRTLDADLGKVSAGEYRAIATFTAAPGTRHAETSDFTPLRQRSTADRVWRWIRDHAGWLLAAILALLLLAGRRRRRSEADA